MLRLQNWKEWWFAFAATWVVLFLGYILIVSEGKFSSFVGFVLAACAYGAFLGLLVDGVVAVARGIYQRVAGEDIEENTVVEQDNTPDDTNGSK